MLYLLLFFDSFAFLLFFFFFNDTATTEIYTLSLHDALPIWEVMNGAAAGRRSCRPGGSAFAAAGPQPGQGLFQDGLTLGVGAPLLHVGQVRLVRLVPRRSRRVSAVLAGREAALRAVPAVRHRRVHRERGTYLVPVRTPERHPTAGSGLTAFRFPHRTCSDPRAPDGAATCHGVCSFEKSS